MRLLFCFVLFCFVIQHEISLNVVNRRSHIVVVESTEWLAHVLIQICSERECLNVSSFRVPEHNNFVITFIILTLHHTKEHRARNQTIPNQESGYRRYKCLIVPQNNVRSSKVLALCNKSSSLYSFAYSLKCSSYTGRIT